MFNQMPFIGREEEISKIETLISQWGTRRVLCIHAPGGIGKTRLLQEVRMSTYQKTALLMADIIDFDDRALQFPQNVELRVAHQLNEKVFQPYLRKLSDWRKMEAAGVSSKILLQQRESVHKIFIDNFNEVSSNQRVALVFDTIEKVQDEVWYNLKRLILASKNALFLLAGRNAKDLWLELQAKLGDEAQLVELSPFEKVFGQQYLEQKQRLLHLNLDPNWKERLLFLAGGKPILLDLVVEWLSHDLPLDWIHQSSLAELQTLSQTQIMQYQMEFEQQLIRHIAKRRTQMDRLTLVMSRVYPLTSTMIMKLLKVSMKDATTLFEDAQAYVFIKSLPDGRISLHDEMRRMVNEYVWPEIDLQEQRRRRDSKIAAQLFEEEHQQLKKQLQERTQPDLGTLFKSEALTRRRDVVEQQWIEHALYANLTLGFEVWTKIVNERRRKSEFSLAKSLLNIVWPYYDQLFPDQQFEFDLLKARLANDTGQVREAEKMLHELLINSQGRKEHEAGIYNALALVEEKLGKLKQARNHQLECLNLVTEINKKSVPFVANRVGYVHRLLGELTEAEKYYKLALRSTDRRNGRLIASLLNNLGNIYGLQMRYRQMELYCRQAIKIWSEIGANREIGRAESTMATFFRIRGQYEKAIILLERAISRYKESDDHQLLSIAYSKLGWTQWYKAEIVDEQAEDIRLLNWNQELLVQASASLNKSLKLAQQYGLEALLPRILHLNALVYWYLGRVRHDHLLLRKGRELNLKSYEKSKQVRDTRYAISSLLADAEWDYEIEKYDKMSYYIQELNKYDPTLYPLYFGRQHRIEADIAFYNGELEKAFSKYAKGLALINQHGGFSRYTIEREILRLENKMNHHMTSEQITKWVEYLYDQWSQIEDQNLDFLTNWCELQLLCAKLRLIG